MIQKNPPARGQYRRLASEHICEECWFWHPRGKPDYEKDGVAYFEWGRCKINPPTVVAADDGEHPWTTEYPECFAEDTCGRFKQAPEVEPR